MPDTEPSLKLPALTLQPLVENAIYHGIEPLPGGGAIELCIDDIDSAITISVSNPIEANQHSRDERLALAFGGAAAMDLSETESRYTVTLTIPKAEAA
jgi:two-component system sensor histidine kinase AlgZ